MKLHSFSMNPTPHLERWPGDEGLRLQTGLPSDVLLDLPPGECSQRNGQRRDWRAIHLPNASSLRQMHVQRGLERRSQPRLQQDPMRRSSINAALESVNLWNTFPDPTFNVPIPAQDGTYMAETLTNDLDNMEYIAPRFLHCFSDVK
uniref:Cadherin_C domain-containing protein n=1 Tax=Bursaphelenchus xylophilus TaxID=6326 RepID=A0A1I7S0P3_BURXY